MHCGVGICGECYEVGSEVDDGCGRPADGARTWHLDLRERPRRPGARPWASRERHPLRPGAPRTTATASISHRASRGARRPHGGLPRHAERAGFRLDSGARVVSRAVPGAPVRADCRCGGVPPHFFSAPMSVDALLGPIRDHMPGSGSSWSISASRDRCSAPSCRCEWTARTADPARVSRPTTARGISRSLERFLEPGPWSGPRYVLEVSSPGTRAAAALARALAPLRRAAGRVEAAALGGRRVVAIVAVPDDEHVTLRRRGDRDHAARWTTSAKRTLVVDWARRHGRRADCRSDGAFEPTLRSTRWQVRPKCWPRSAS